MLKYRVIKRGHWKIAQDELNRLKWRISTFEGAIRFVICGRVNAGRKRYARRRSIEIIRWVTGLRSLLIAGVGKGVNLVDFCSLSFYVGGGKLMIRVCVSYTPLISSRRLVDRSKNTPRQATPTFAIGQFYPPGGWDALIVRGRKSCVNILQRGLCAFELLALTLCFGGSYCQICHDYFSRIVSNVRAFCFKLGIKFWNLSLTKVCIILVISFEYWNFNL